MTVDVDGHPVAVKLALHDGALVNAQPEYDDVARAAAALGPAGQGRPRRRRRREPHLSTTPSGLHGPRVIALTFVAIFVVELPDKTFIATLVLSTRYRPLLVWIGVGLAFPCRPWSRSCSATPRVPARGPGQGVAPAMFLVGAVLLFREAPPPTPPRRAGGGVRRQGRRGAPASRRCSRASWCSSPPSGATCPSC